MNSVFEKKLSLATHAKKYNDISQKVLDLFGKNALAIVMYGSCLSPKTQKSDSVPDYFVIVDDFSSYYPSKKNAWLNRILSPNIFHFEIPQGFSKYSVVSLKQLQDQTSSKAQDMYFLGRFSKSMYVFWSKSDQVLDQLVDIQQHACKNVSTYVLSSLALGDALSLEEFILKCIGLSYVGDVRVEAADKIEKLYQAEKTFYTHVYESVLKQLHADKVIFYHGQVLKVINKDKLPQNYKNFILKSKVRSQLRWPKAMLTAKNWLDYVLLKIKRNYGEEFTLNDRQKKYWFIYGWALLFKLNRKKMLK